MIGVDWLQSMLGIWRCLLVGPQHLLSLVLCIEWPGFTFLQVQDYCLVHVLLSYMSRSDHCKNHLSVIFQQKKNKNEISWPKELEVVTSRSSGEWYRRILGEKCQPNAFANRSLMLNRRVQFSPLSPATKLSSSLFILLNSLGLYLFFSLSDLLNWAFSLPGMILLVEVI